MVGMLLLRSGLVLVTAFLYIILTNVAVLANDNDSINMNTQPVSSQSGVALDASWEFNDGGVEGWAMATSNEMHAHVSHHDNGEMRIQFLAVSSSSTSDSNNSNSTGDREERETHVDSPPIFLSSIPLQQVVAIRYRYVGDQRRGKLRLRGGSQPPPSHNSAWDVPSNTTNGTIMVTTDDYFADVFYSVRGDGKWHTTYAYFSASVMDDHHNNATEVTPFTGNLTQMRLFPATSSIPSSISSHSNNSNNNKSGQSFHIDWIRLVRGPSVQRVTGCKGEQHSDSSFQNHDDDIVSSVQHHVRTHHDFVKSHHTTWLPYNNTSSNNSPCYSRVYNCLVHGGETITLEGTHFGTGTDVAASVYVDSKPCVNVTHDARSPQTKLTCVTPSRDDDNNNDYTTDSRVEIRHGVLPGLRDTVSYFRYAVPPPRPVHVTVSNVAARYVPYVC